MLASPEVHMVDIKKYGIAPVGALPNENQIAHLKLSRKVFFHFGVNTFTSSEWGNGNENADIFSPTELDTDQWLKVAKDAGFKLAILTVKHHDGFCLWPSRYTSHSVKNSPYKSGRGDIVREFVNSCHKYGLKVGIYISPWDRNSPHWGRDSYNEYFNNQLTELMTEYGEIHEVWWDGAGSRDAVYDWDLWEATVRRNQPKAVIFGSMGAAGHIDFRWSGNERGYASPTHYASIDLTSVRDEIRSELNEGKLGGEVYLPCEVDVSIRPGWFYHPDQDDKVKSPKVLNEIWFNSVGRNAVMLLNFPPDRRGLILDTEAENARLSYECIKAMLEVNYFENASVIHDGESFTVKDELDGESFTVYKSRVMEITLPSPTLINVFSLGELVEAGERVYSFKLEVLDDGEPVLLFEGSSVGFRRTFRIAEGEYSRLRLTIMKSIDTPYLKDIGIHYIKDFAEGGEHSAGGELVRAIEWGEDRHSATVSFGGIYPFNSVEFTLDDNAPYRVYAFSGQVFEEILSGTGPRVVSRALPSPILDSYQIKIEADTKISAISVRLK